MVFSESMQFNQNTSDNLQIADNIVPLLKKSNEIIRVREKSSIISGKTNGHSFILGATVNGVLGVANGDDGQQIVLGDYGRIETVLSVTNPNNLFRETFRFTHFKDTTLPCTANWDVTNFRLSMATTNNHAMVYNTVAHFNRIYLSSTTINTVYINADETKFGEDIISYEVRCSLSDSWQEVSLNTQTSITVPGTMLYLRITFFGNGGSDTFLQDLTVSYG